MTNKVEKMIYVTSSQNGWLRQTATECLYVKYGNIWVGKEIHFDF
jgi:hypothetical protein